MDGAFGGVLMAAAPRPYSERLSQESWFASGTLRIGQKIKQAAVDRDILAL